eukprot:TRINITY_DN309_c1_g2_i1.p1 TRINITY_DN309_c1_g2~~TRINITY_DN309_c1_g2_i1.p1  ORF type:complete len:394 (-),score=104.03 TRINITY_DN309_c1_g2_i1:92-1273(-)
MDQELKDKEIKRRTRTYKSTNPTKIINDGWCHQCKIKQPEVLACVNFWKNRKNKKCNGKYCPKCIDKHYNEDYEKLKSQEEWICYSCEYICKCASCKRKRGSYVCRRKTPNGKKMKGEIGEEDSECDGQYAPQYDQFEDRYEKENQHVEYNQSLTHQHNQYYSTQQQQQYMTQYYPQYIDNSQQHQYMSQHLGYVPPQYQIETKILYNNVDPQPNENHTFDYNNIQYNNNNYNTHQQYIQYDNEIADPGQHNEPYPIEPNISNHNVNMIPQMESQLPSISNLFNLFTSQELPNIYNHPNNIYQPSQQQSRLDHDFFRIPISFKKGLPPIRDRSKLSFLINKLEEEISADNNNQEENPTSNITHNPLSSNNDENNINNTPNNNPLPIHLKKEPK